MDSSGPGRSTPHPDSDRLGRALEKCLTHLVPWSGLMFRADGIDDAKLAQVGMPDSSS